MKRHTRFLMSYTSVATVLASLLCSSTTVFAQTSPSSPAGANIAEPAPQLQTPADASSAAPLADIVVTAERRGVNIQRLPIAVQALTGADLAERGVSNVNALQQSTPALAVNETALATFVNIRGIGLNAVSPVTSSGVANYRDGLFIPKEIYLDQPYYDVERVEVYRGPQGTLVGQNSTGGAIFTISNSPRIGKHDGFVEVNGGNYGTFGARGAVNLPVDDKLALRAAFNVETRDSYWTNKNPAVRNSDAGNLLRGDLRLGLLYKPTDRLQVLFKAEGSRRVGDGIPYKPIPGTIYAGADVPGDFNYLSDRTDNKDRKSVARIGMQVDWDFADAVKLRSITGYQYGKYELNYDVDGTALNGAYQSLTTSSRDVSQELNLISTGSGPLQWVVGALYLHDNTPANFNIFNVSATGSAAFPLVIVGDAKGRQDSYGIFGQSTYKLSPQFEVVAGIRQSRDRKYDTGGTLTIGVPTTALSTSTAPVLQGAVIPLKGEQVSNATTGKIALNWTPDSRNLVYISVSKGYKAGGYNNTGLTVSTFAPEQVYNYEAGWKSTLLDGRIRTQLNGFYMDYSNFQLNTFDPNTQLATIRNAANATIKGFEGQVQGRFGSLGFDSSFAFVDSTIKSLSLVDVRQLPGGGNVPLPAGFDFTPYTVSLAGRSVPFAPRWTANGGLNYQFELKDGATLKPRVQVSYLSGQWAVIYQAGARDYIPARTLLDLRLTYAKSDWTVEGYVQNATDNHYIAAKYEDKLLYGTPLTVGGRVAYRF